jgi:transposase
MKTYSLDLRERVVWAVELGEAVREEIAEEFGVSTSWIKKLIRQQRDTGSIAPLPHGGGRHPAYEGRKLERLKQALADHPDATLEELRDQTNKSASIMAVHRALRRLGARRKKSRSVPPNRTGPMSP